MKNENEYEKLTEEEINAYVNNVEVPDLWDRISSSYDKEIELMKGENNSNNIVSFEKEKKKRSSIWKKTMVSVAAAALVVVIAIPIIKVNNKGDSKEGKKTETDKSMDIDIQEESAVMKDYDLDITKNEITGSNDAESESVQDEVTESPESESVREDVTRIPERIKVTAYYEQKVHEFTSDEVEMLSDILSLSELNFISEEETQGFVSEYTVELSDDTGAGIKLEISELAVKVTLYVPDESGEVHVEYGKLDDNTVPDLYEYMSCMFDN